MNLPPGRGEPGRWVYEEKVDGWRVLADRNVAGVLLRRILARVERASRGDIAMGPSTGIAWR